MLKKVEYEYNYQELSQIIERTKVIDFIEDHYKISLTLDKEDLVIETNNDEIVQKVSKLFNSISYIKSKGIILEDKDIFYLNKKIEENQLDEVLDLFTKRVKIVSNKFKVIYCKTLKQKEYINAIEKNDMIFSIGPAGTGKTYLAVMDAIRRLKEKDIKKIILTRPAVEAGESLGFLPGDLKEKIDPYLMPLYDALYEIFGKLQVDEMIAEKIIEIAPLAYMRGRTLDNAVVILDEAQNTTEMQMKMFLTRLGANSKMIITGDLTQTDLKNHMTSGLYTATKILKNIKGIKIVEFDNSDVVRHPLVKKILARYDEYENKPKL